MPIAVSQSRSLNPQVMTVKSSLATPVKLSVSVPVTVATPATPTPSADGKFTRKLSQAELDALPILDKLRYAAWAEANGATVTHTDKPTGIQKGVDWVTKEVLKGVINRSDASAEAKANAKNQIDNSNVIQNLLNPVTKFGEVVVVTGLAAAAGAALAPLAGAGAAGTSSASTVATASTAAKTGVSAATAVKGVLTAATGVASVAKAVGGAIGKKPPETLAAPSTDDSKVSTGNALGIAAVALGALLLK